RNRSSTLYPHDIYTLDTANDYTYKQFEAFLANETIRTALANYLIDEPKTTQIQTPTYTIPVKCNIKLNGKPYYAVIDSGAAISMISNQVVRELGLKIEAPSSSLIVLATGPSVRPLGIIKNLPIEIEGTIIPMDVEVMNATSYSLLLGNDWSQKVDASYSWKNKAYTLRWNKKKIHIPTTYEHDQPLPAQPTITDEKKLEKFEQEYLHPKEAYVIEIEPDNWTTVTYDPDPVLLLLNRNAAAVTPTIIFMLTVLTMNVIVVIVTDTLLHTARSRPPKGIFAKPALNLAIYIKTVLIIYVINVESMDTSELTAPK